MPTAPEIWPTAMAARARVMRPMSRPSWSYQSASFRPNVIGSACTPCVRPIIGVRRCSSARVRTAARSSPSSFRMRSVASTICSACAVSTTSDEVRPKCSQRADGPTCSATEVVKAMTSCCVVFSISSMRAMSKRGLRAQFAGGLDRHDAGGGHRVGGGQFDGEPRLVAPLFGPDAPHLGVGVSPDHARASCSASKVSGVPPPSTVRLREPVGNSRCATRATSGSVTASMALSMSSSDSPVSP